MIGNDIVDLAQSRLQSKWSRKGLIEKLFTTEEQYFIKKHYNPEIMVWLLWTMKEAAYKIYNRQTKIREFSPKKLICDLNSLSDIHAFGTVFCLENIYYTKSIISSENIHSIATNNLENLNHVIEVEKKDIIKDNHGIPYLQTSTMTLKEVSISNHGRFEKVVTYK
ncbi:phosphopantetheinyl transferase (holo-ACP synthase) [Flavobacterium nitrogenifigens]|uniref:Phosphopantetheinyl transferase (Holo-ACP synthase) n=2 Tax=Flavobacterium TaxID=237 RepID=A0A7W7IY66_9FLAO|nr:MULTISPECIES: 4'-phosphopantetheinyl transferase superfamily protein [Flavobacterium]MBB4802687.1 phosphopantetheinyl transferase (holo-ACP synthase) [Flavobacterium nitrogenifigens]MBB6387645.1 phosphopantetheinyl transferase (holo-ACP synthase) [Flavobacterium notoginsengisoli]